MLSYFFRFLQSHAAARTRIFWHAFTAEYPRIPAFAVSNRWRHLAGGSCGIGRFIQNVICARRWIFRQERSAMKTGQDSQARLARSLNSTLANFRSNWKAAQAQLF